MLKNFNDPEIRKCNLHRLGTNANDQTLKGSGGGGGEIGRLEADKVTDPSMFSKLLYKH